MAEQKGYTHDTLTVKCQINADELDETEATITNESQFDTLLSHITRIFPSLQHIDKSQWTLCIQSQFIDENDMNTFQSILSTIPPPAVVDIVWKTGKQPVKRAQVKSMPKYLINVHFEGKKFIHKIYKDKSSWDEQIFNDLKSVVSQQFNLRVFNLYQDGDISIDDIDDFTDAFDEFDSDDSDDSNEQDKTTPSVNIFVKDMAQKPVKKMIERPNISVIHESHKVISLGRRLKLLVQCIGYNKYVMDENDSKSELESISLEYVLKDLKKIGLVEGHDKNSHIILTLNNISKQVSSKNLNEALKTINSIMGEIMPFDYEEFFQLFEKTKDTAIRLKNKVCWVLLGPTGAGKSTSIHFFCGSKFIKGTGGAVIVNDVDKSLKNKDIKVGEAVTESKTRYIEEVELDLNQYKNHIPCLLEDRNEPRKIIWVDSPGFEDTAGAEVNVANGIGTIRALKNAEAVKVIITVKEAHLDYRFHIIRNIANNMGKAINNLQGELDKRHGSPIAGFLTQSEHGKESAQKIFSKAYNEQKEKESNKNEDALFMALIYKLGIKGPLNNIKIDVENPEKNEETRIKIIKSLVENVGYIETPKATFNEFISDSAVTKLKQQIERNYNTIENILVNDKYFQNPNYIKYIIDILNNIEKLRDIIKNAGGKFVGERLVDCMGIFKTKWNNKIDKGNAILSNIDIKDCKMKLLNKKLKAFHDIKYMMKHNVKEIKASKYYKEYELKDVNCLNDGLHDAFDEIYKIIKDYLDTITNTLKLDDSDVDIETDDDRDDRKLSVENIDNDNYNDNYSDIYSEKNILLSIKKCFLLYTETQQYKDIYIKKKIRKLEKLVQEVIEDLNNKLDRFMQKKESQNVNGISKLIFMFSGLSKLYKIVVIMDEYSNNKLSNIIPNVSRENSDELGDDDEHVYDDNANKSNKSSKINKMIKTLTQKLKKNIAKSIKNISKSYSLNVMEVNMYVYDDDDENKMNIQAGNNYYVDVNALLKSQLLQTIKTDDNTSGENKLISFCLWMNKLYESLRNANLNKDLEIWLNNTQNKWMEWLCGACFDELKKCNDLLLTEGAKSWNNVEKLLIHCASLREIDYVGNNTSQEYFKIQTEFDSGKAELAKKAGELIDKLNKDDENVDYDEIIKIANQLFNAGCSIDDPKKINPEMRQIYNKLKLHLVDLKTKTEAIVLSIEMSDDLNVIQNTMNELDTLQKFAAFMPKIQNDANECYKKINDQVLDVLNEIKSNYNLSKCSTENSKVLKDKLIKFERIKSKIDKTVLNNVIMQCELKTLTELINLNEEKINKLQDENKLIEQEMEKKCGKVMENIKKYEKLVKKGNRLLLEDDDDDNILDQWLNKHGVKSVREIKNKLQELKEQSDKVCNKEKEEKKKNINEINELDRINKEVQKCVEAENNLISLIGDTVIEYRKDNDALKKHIAHLKELLDKNQNYIFSQKLALYEAYNALMFLSKCKDIRWNVSNKIEEKKDEFTCVLSNKYVNEINKNILKYLKAYGDNLESNLNDLIRNLAVKNVGNCHLNDAEYVKFTQDTIAKLNLCLLEFRDISNFDRRLEDTYNYDDDKKRKRRLKLVSCLFTTHDIQVNVDEYINNIISMHKNDININFAQFRTHSQDKLPLLRFICLEMSALDRFVSLKSNEHDTYYRIATQIDGALTEFGNDNTKDILRLFENGSFSRLAEILNGLKKIADADKEGIAQKNYRGAVMQLFSVLNKSINETKTKLLIEISKDSNIDNKKILDLNNGLKDVKHLVETIYPHLYKNDEKNKVKTEEKELGNLLFARLTQLMTAAVQSATKKDFRTCEKRLDNIARFMDHSTQFYVYGNIENENKNENDNKNEDENENKNDNENKNKNKNNNNIATEYNKILKQIDAALKDVLKQVKKANESLRKPNGFNPYRCLRLTTLHDQLSKSQNEKFRTLWDNIYEDIINEIQIVLNEIKARSNQIKIQSEYKIEDTVNKVMTHGEKEALLRKIDMSSASFPTEMKHQTQTMLKDAKECAKGNMKFIGEGYQQFLDTNDWNQIARNLNDFRGNDPKLFQSSKKQLITKISKIRETFHNNMKNIPKGFMDNIDKLDLYRSIGLSFTRFTYYGNNINDDINDDINYNGNNVIVIPHIKSTLESMYKSIEHQFINKCTDIRTSLKGQNLSYKNLKGGFDIVICVLENKDNLPQKFAENMMNEARQLYKPIQKFIQTLKSRKKKGLDKDINDIDPLIATLDDLKALNDAQFHANIRKFIPFMDEKENTIEQDIANIEYDATVNETKEMLNEFRDTISKKGLNKNIIQKNQSKRLTYLKSLSMKCKALINSSSIAVKHLDYDTKHDFDKKFIAPCTKKMKNDIKDMQIQTNKAFRGQILNTKDLKRANANIEAFHAIKCVFEKEIGIDDPICNEIEIGNAIEDCQQTATKKVKQLSKNIQKINQIQLNEDNTDEFFRKCAENLLNLEYLNLHMNFKTSITENAMNTGSINEQNELLEEIQTAIKQSLHTLTHNKQTKSKMMVLYNHLVAADANYGSVFTQKHTAFKAASAEAWRKKCRELDIDALIENLKQTKTEMQEMKECAQLIEIDYDQIRDIFERIMDKYKTLLTTNLSQATSFKQLQNRIPTIASDAKCIAKRAVRSKKSALDSIKSSIKNWKNWANNTLSWAMGQTQVKTQSKSTNPRDCYWTIEMRNVVPELISYVLAIWTLSDASCYYGGSSGSLTQARNQQIIAIICILCLDIDSREKKLINNLVEVGTGEGKSVIMAVTSIVLALLDFDVYCACYSELLSKRDQNAFDYLFRQFGVSNNIQYQTFNKILEQMINDGGDVREVTKNIVLSNNIYQDEKDDEKDDEKEQNNLFYNRPKILFIDEVDKFFSIDFFGQQYTPSCVIPKQEMKDLILFVWNEYRNNGSNGKVITIQKIEQSNQYKNLLSAFNKEWHGILNESIKDMVHGIRNFRDDSYKIQNGKDICYKFSDKYSSKVFYGYRTLFAYLYEFHNGNIKDEEYVHDKLTWFSLKCGSFSYSEIPNNFYAILGVTGTLKSLSAKEHEVIQGSYGIKKYIVMPSLFDKSGKLDYAQNKDIFIIKSERYFDQLHSTIEKYLINDIQTIERPAIIFFKDEKRLNDFYQQECCKTWRLNDRIHLLTPDLNQNEKKIGIVNATIPYCITFATEEYGRGIDFQVRNPKLGMKGMHVELTYWPDTLAEEIQIKGRTARQGDPGSFHIFLNEEKIKDQCTISDKDIDLHKKNGDLYEWLNEIRAEVFAQQYNKASDYVKELKPIHKQSEQLAMALRTKNIKIAKENLLLFNKGANIQSDAKLSILIDATGSMYSCLSQCKIVIQKTIPKLVEFLNDNNMDTSFEIQIIAYRNYDAYADDILDYCAFTSDVNQLSGFVHSLAADYGWGEEAVEVAFGQLNRQQKKPNIVILIADAPAQTKQAIIRKRKQRGKRYWETEQGGIFKEGLDWKEELKKFMKKNKGASVFTFYLSNFAKNNFQEIAKIGKGKSMYLNVDNEAKSIKLLQAAFSETLLLKINNGSMEGVEKFRAQSKNMPTFL